jgi:hypothetical protein
MLTLILQIVLTALVVYEIRQRIRLSWRLTQLEYTVERHNQQLWDIVRDVRDLVILTGHQNEIIAVQKGDRT